MAFSYKQGNLQQSNSISNSFLDLWYLDDASPLALFKATLGTNNDFETINNQRSPTRMWICKQKKQITRSEDVECANLSYNTVVIEVVRYE